VIFLSSFDIVQLRVTKLRQHMPQLHTMLYVKTVIFLDILCR